jgi:hypothetical protein
MPRRSRLPATAGQSARIGLAERCSAADDVFFAPAGAKASRSRSTGPSRWRLRDPHPGEGRDRLCPPALSPRRAATGVQSCMRTHSDRQQDGVARLRPAAPSAAVMRRVWRKSSTSSETSGQSAAQIITTLDSLKCAACRRRSGLYPRRPVCA